MGIVHDHDDLGFALLLDHLHEEHGAKVEWQGACTGSFTQEAAIPFRDLHRQIHEGLRQEQLCVDGYHVAVVEYALEYQQADKHRRSEMLRCATCGAYGRQDIYNHGRLPIRAPWMLGQDRPWTTWLIWEDDLP